MERGLDKRSSERRGIGVEGERVDPIISLEVS